LIELFIYAGITALAIQGVLSIPIVWGWLKYSKPKPKITPPFTIIICAHNEEKKLPTCLASISKINYSDWQVIIVNDRSTDNTENIIYEWKAQIKGLRIISILETPEGWPPKKYALTQGIKNCTTEWMAFTDADCIVPSDWLESLAAEIRPQKTQLILGNSPYLIRSGFLNKLIQYETQVTAWMFLGLGSAGLPYMGVGRNIAYTKSLFNAANGFTQHLKSLSGDDDLLVNQIAKGSETEIMPYPWVYSYPQETWKKWFRQKQRHFSAGNWYRPSWKIYLSLWAIAELIGWIGGIIALFQGIWWPLPIALTIKGIFLLFVPSPHKPLHLFVFLPITDFLLMLFRWGATLAGFMFEKKWN